MQIKLRKFKMEGGGSHPRRSRVAISEIIPRSIFDLVHCVVTSDKTFIKIKRKGGGGRVSSLWSASERRGILQ